MIHARRTTTLIGGLLTAGALTLATPGLADAATSVSSDAGKVTAKRLDADSERNQQDGDGDADARARANRSGNLYVFGESEGGGAGGIGLTDTTADARASVTKRSSAADGTYRITVKYNGAKGTDRDRNDGAADVDLRTRVSFGGAGGDSGPTLRRNTELTGNGRNRTLSFTYKVPDGDSGRLVVNAMLQGTSSAPAQGDRGQFRGSVNGVDIKVKRIGGGGN